MTHTDVEALELTDPELISRVREGDVAAYGTLFSRHVDAATRLARLLIRGSDADDLVSEAFVKVLNVLLGGGGPDVAFRAYLLTAVRRLHIDKMRSNQRLTTTDDLTPFDPGVQFTDTAVAGFEGGAAAKAFASLPERWQLVLWHLEVENQKPADIAPLLGMTPNSVSALAYRAREGLRQAFLNMHSGDLVSEACRETNDSLGGYVRGALSRRDAAKVEDHLEHCRRCTAVYLELSEVNSSLAAVLGPALLGSAAAAYLGGGAATGVGAGILLLLGRGKDAVVAHASVAAATAAVVGVAGITAVTLPSHGDASRPSAAQPPTSSRVLPSFILPTPPDPALGKGQQGKQKTTPPGASTPVAVTLASPGSNAPATDSSSSDSSVRAGQQAAKPAAGQQVAEPAPGTTHSKLHSRRPSTGHKPRDVSPPTGTSGGSTSPRPTPQPPPRPAPEPKPKPTPKPPPGSPEPTPQPPPPPPAPRADVSVRAWTSSGSDRGHVTITVQVSGVPSGREARLTATASTGDLHGNRGNCRRAGKGYSCMAHSGRSTYSFVVHGSSGPTVTFSVAPPNGCTDPSTGNNSTTVHVPRNDHHNDQGHDHGNNHGHDH